MKPCYCHNWYDQAHWRAVGVTNGLEQFNKQIRHLMLLILIFRHMLLIWFPYPVSSAVAKLVQWLSRAWVLTVFQLQPQGNDDTTLTVSVKEIVNNTLSSENSVSFSIVQVTRLKKHHEYLNLKTVRMEKDTCYSRFCLHNTVSLALSLKVEFKKVSQHTDFTTLTETDIWTSLSSSCWAPGTNSKQNHQKKNAAITPF